jgi:hypothetical protein
MAKSKAQRASRSAAQAEKPPPGGKRARDDTAEPASADGAKKRARSVKSAAIVVADRQRPTLDARKGEYVATVPMQHPSLPYATPATAVCHVRVAL